MPSEHCLRTRLTIPEQRRLFDYWRDCAGGRAMPSRHDLDPAAIPDLLPSIGLIDCGPDFDAAVVRLAGSRLRDIYGFELTGKRLGEVAWGDRTGYWANVYSRIVGARAPLAGAVRGPVAMREHVPLLWLRLPLSADGRRVNMILCYDMLAPVGRVSADATWSMPSFSPAFALAHSAR